MRQSEHPLVASRDFKSAPTIKCLFSDPSKISVAFDPILDDSDNPWERILRITNGLRPWDADYEGVVLSINLILSSHLRIGTLECTDGVTFDIPSKHQKPRPPINAHVVHRDGGIWAESDGKSLSPFVAPNLQAIIMQTVTDAFRRAGRGVNWEDDVFQETNEL